MNPLSSTSRARPRSGWLCASLLCLACCLISAQTPGQPANIPAKNPLAGNQDAIRNGMAIFRGACADCHAIDARGARGPDLTRLWANGATDDRLFQIVRRGIPGTEMPPTNPLRTNDT